MIEIYAGSMKTGNVLSSSMYTKTDLKDIFGEDDAAKLLAGIRINNEKKTTFWQLATAFNKEQDK